MTLFSQQLVSMLFKMNQNPPFTTEERQGTISNVYEHILFLDPCNSSRNWALELLLDLGILENSFGRPVDCYNENNVQMMDFYVQNQSLG